MKEYDRIQIQEICSRICSGGTPKSTVEKYYGGNIPWLNTKEVNFNRIHSTERTITEEGLLNSSAKWIDENAVIVAMYGATAGKSAISKIRLTTNQACCNLNIDPDKADYRFVYYALYNDYNRLASLANGGAQQNLNAMQIKEFEIPYPSIEEQTAIAIFLSALDDKIEVNRQINDNLEQQAQATFNNIIANSANEKTVQLSEIAWLNPKRIIPKGTVARSIEMAHLPITGSFPSGWEMKEYNGGMKFQNGDTLMARITPCLENGKVAFINFLDDNEIAFGSTEYITLTPKREFAPEVLYFLVRNNDFVDFAVKNMNGSSGRQRVSADTIGTYELPDITQYELHMLETVAKESLTKIKYNSLENMRLAEIRDTLLPKLMSGELKFNEIDC
ncbi:MAG: restriction endonuclease subunit S [Bacteroidales bacterium]|nr:restriction endonuclease subunit S [Bacteroidales bacterium]